MSDGDARASEESSMRDPHRERDSIAAPSVGGREFARGHERIDLINASAMSRPHPAWATRQIANAMPPSLAPIANDRDWRLPLSEDESPRYHWTDLLVAFAGVCAFGTGVWATLTNSETPRVSGWAVSGIAFIVGGLLALLGLFVAQRRQLVGRAAIILGGLLQSAVPFAYRSAATVPMRNAVIIGLVLVVAGCFAGPVAERGIP
jgi:hypothetical protein